MNTDLKNYRFPIQRTARFAKYYNAPKDAVENNYTSDVVGNKEDTAKEEVGVIASIIAYIKGLLNKNARVEDAVGSRTDKSFSNFELGFNPTILGHLRANYYHAHGNSFTIPDNEPVLVTPGNGAYVYGAPALVGTYASKVFDVHWVSIMDIGNNGYYNVQLCNVDGTVIYGKTSASRTNNFTQEGNVPIQVSPIPAGTNIYARVGVSTGNIAHTVRVKLFCHPYNDIS